MLMSWSLCVMNLAWLSKTVGTWSGMNSSLTNLISKQVFPTAPSLHADEG